MEWKYFPILTFATFVLPTGLTRMVSKNFLDKCVGSLFEEIDNSVVQGIFVLFQPGRDVVWDLCWGKVRIRVSC